MSTRIKVATKDHLAPGQGLMVKAKGHQIAVFNIKGQFFALNNSCTHSGGPLGKGRLFNGVVTCPWHGAQFDVKTGECLAEPATTNVETFPVQVEGNSVFVDIA
jgi:nitrite reductase/ring-hydroxylating ferredoxin subunit